MPVAVVTGAGGPTGIGFATARRLHASIKSNPTSLLIHSNRRRLTDYAKLVIHAASEKSRYVLFCSILLFELQLTLSSAMRVALHAVPAQHSTFHAHLSALVVAEALPIDMPRPSSGDV